MEKYQNKYRIASARARWWDYGWNGAYFITICTRNREHYFGAIENEKMTCTPLGTYAETCWHAIPNHFPFVQLDAFVVMPNHVHGIIIIDKQDVRNVETQDFASLQPTKLPVPGTSNNLPEQSRNKFGPQSRNLASVARGFKIGVTKHSKIISPGFSWQPRFHDHIIRNREEYLHISDYIIHNPSRWREDRFYGE